MKIKTTFQNGIWTIQLEYQGTVYRADSTSRSEAMREAFKLVEVI